MSALAVLTDEQRSFLAELERSVRETVEEHGRLEPFGFVFTGEGAVDIYALGFATERTKQTSLEFLRERARQTRAAAVCIVSEAWGVLRDAEDVKAGNLPPARNEPDRREVVVVSFETAFVSLVAVSPLVSRRGGGRTFEALEWSTETGGEATGLIPRAASPSVN